MRWFQPIECDNTVKNPIVCDYSNFEEHGFNEDDFIKGREILNWPDNIIMRSSQKKYDGTPDDVLQNAYMIPIFSKKLTDSLIEADIKGIQFLSLKVLNYEEEIEELFYIANFLNYTKAFDSTKSIYNRFSEDFPNPNVRGKIAGVVKFVLIKEKINEFDIIRLQEYNQRFFVSEKIVKLFEKNKFTGYSFKEIQLV